MKSNLLLVSAAAIVVAAFAWAGCGSDDSEGGAGAAGTAGAAGAGKGGAAGSVNKGGEAGSVNKGGEAGTAQGGSAGSATGGSAGTGTGGSAGGSTDCTGIFTGECGTCLETNCCKLLADCNNVTGCVDCIGGDEASCDANNQAAVEALFGCAETSCNAECLGGGTPDVEPACGAPMTSPSAGSCITIDANAGIECNPVTNEGCDTAAGEACDFSQNGFTCYPAPNDTLLCGACDNSAGPFCAGGMSCPGGKCAKFCCNDGDCGAGGKCDTALTGMDVGFCVVGDADAGVPEAGPEAAAEAAVDTDAAADAAAE